MFPSPNTESLVSTYIYFTTPQLLIHLLTVSYLKTVISISRRYKPIRAGSTVVGIFHLARDKPYKNIALLLKDA